MKSIDQSVYDKDYYNNTCLGSSEFKKYSGTRLNPEALKVISYIPIKKTDIVLDIGCGRGDISYYLSKKAKKMVGIDYSEAAIKIAKNIKITGNKNNLVFKKMNATKLDFESNYFDLIICIDVFEHLNKSEVNKMMKNIKKILKPNGTLFIHTGTNKLYNDKTYRYYVRPINYLLTKVDKLLRNKVYDPLPIDPRTKTEKIQHINEPTYNYLKNTLDNFGFKSDIMIRVDKIKKGSGSLVILYNFINNLYPLSKYYPLNRLFGWAFVCISRNIKR